jgi:alkaline phosphatase
MTTDHAGSHQMGRRAFLKDGTLVLTAAAASASQLQAADAEPLKIGLVTDLHYADKPPRGSRYYRETPDKLAEAAEQFGKDQLDFVVELGDFIDAADSVDLELSYLKRINRDFESISPKRHYVLGNHCVDTLTKQEFLGEVGQAKSYYSFDADSVHFIVLDSCFRSDGQPYGRKNFEWTDANIPTEELDWLKSDLQATSKPTIVFAHQRLDIDNHYAARNAAAVREALAASNKVLAVFQGHSHKNDHKEIAGIHYCTLVAMVEGSGASSSGYSLLTVQPNGTLNLTGFRKQQSREWPR